jgi:hypothetical protein
MQVNSMIMSMFVGISVMSWVAFCSFDVDKMACQGLNPGYLVD